MRKFIAILLTLVMILSVSVPVALAADNGQTIPTAPDTSDEVLANYHSGVLIYFIIVAVLAVAAVVVILVKMKNLKKEA